VGASALKGFGSGPFSQLTTIVALLLDGLAGETACEDNQSK